MPDEVEQQRQLASTYFTAIRAFETAVRVDYAQRRLFVDEAVLAGQPVDLTIIEQLRVGLEETNRLIREENLPIERIQLRSA